MLLQKKSPQRKVPLRLNHHLQTMLLPLRKRNLQITSQLRRNLHPIPSLPNRPLRLFAHHPCQSPAVPRRAAPPRKKPAKSPSPAPPPAPSEESEPSPPESAPANEPTPPHVLNTEFTESPSPAPALDAEIQSKEVEEAVEESKEIEELGSREPEMSPEVSPATVAQIKEETKELEPTKDVIEPDDSEEPADTIAHDEDIEAPVKELESHVEPTREVEIEPTSVEEEPEVIDHSEQSHKAQEFEEEPVSEEPATIEEPEPTEEPKPVEEPKVEEAPKVEEEAEEEDEVARRKRIAERLAKMGGVNPFAGPPPPVRKPTLPISPTSPTGSVGALPTRKESLDVVQSEPSPVSPPIPTRRESTDSAVLGRRTSLRRGSTDSTSSQPLRSPPLLPTSPKPTLPTRKDSLNSIGSGTGPQRRASQDDRDREPQVVESLISQQHIPRLSPSQELSEEPENPSTTSFTAEPEEDDFHGGEEALSGRYEPGQPGDRIEYAEYQYNTPRGESEIHESGLGRSPVSVAGERRSSSSARRSSLLGEPIAEEIDDRVSYLEIEEEEEIPYQKGPELFEEEEYSPPELNPGGSCVEGRGR
ncbi:hypothetical protein QCA50_015382 [Cerrena zonata]|uniref:Uncharacterized protein n=1 Tax=Cerrena zonata TaxID=2478898 RepID=A0AAW0FVP4_9APHY